MVERRPHRVRHLALLECRPKRRIRILIEGIQVVAEGSREEDGILRDDREARAEVGEAQLRDVHAVNGDPAIGSVVTCIQCNTQHTKQSRQAEYTPSGVHDKYTAAKYTAAKYTAAKYTTAMVAGALAPRRSKGQACLFELPYYIDVVTLGALTTCPTRAL